MGLLPSSCPWLRAMCLERYDLALQEVQRALEQDPNAAAPHICGAWVLRRQGKLHEAEQARPRGSRPSRSRPPHTMFLGCVMLYQFHLHEAEAAFILSLLNPTPTNAVADQLCSPSRRHRPPHRGLSDRRARTGASAGECRLPRVHGIALRGLGRAASAAAASREVLRLDPRNFEAHNNLGVLELHAGRGAVALDCFREALRLKPGDRTALTNLWARSKPATGSTARCLRWHCNPRFTRFVRWSIAAYFVLLFLFAALSDYNPIFDIIGRTFASGFLLFFLWVLVRSYGIGSSTRSSTRCCCSTRSAARSSMIPPTAR